VGGEVRADLYNLTPGEAEVASTGLKALWDELKAAEDKRTNIQEGATEKLGQTLPETLVDLHFVNGKFLPAQTRWRGASRRERKHKKRGRR
jgi:hypothetical protein